MLMLSVLVLESEQKRDQAKSFLQDFCWSKSIGYFYPENFCPGQMQAVWLGLPPLQSLPFPPRQSVQVDVRAVCADVRLNFIVF